MQLHKRIYKTYKMHQCATSINNVSLSDCNISALNQQAFKKIQLLGPNSIHTHETLRMTLKVTGNIFLDRCLDKLKEVRGRNSKSEPLQEQNIVTFGYRLLHFNLYHNFYHISLSLTLTSFFFY